MAHWSAEGKTFLITGAASGLGALYAEAFLKEGAKQIVIADIDEEKGKVTAARLNGSYPGKVVFVKCDVSSEEQISATFDRALAELQRIDVLINNAGIMSDHPAVVRKACDVNWQGTVSFTMRAVKHMGKDEGGVGGTIINISSIAGISKYRPMPAYAGSKAAVILFGKSLADGEFFQRTGVRVLTICPGPTDTPLMQGLKQRSYNDSIGEEFEKEYEQIIKVSPPQKPESAAAACVKVFKEGDSGSVWLTIHDRPAKDFTAIVEKHLAEMLTLLH